jgi:hypothetical protein
VRRAALYAWNRGALVIVDDGEPPRIVDAIDFAVSEADPYALANWVTSFAVERLLVPAMGGPQPEAAQNLVAFVVGLCSRAGVEVVSADEARRKAHRGAAAKLAPWPGHPEVVRDAIAMMLADVGGRHDEDRSKVGGDGQEADARGVPHATPRTEGGAPVVAALPPDLACAGDARPEMVKGPRVAGIDPGERWIAVCIGAGREAPLVYVDSFVVEVERTGKEQPTDEQLDAAVGKAVDFCERHGVERAAVERAVNVHRKPGASPESAAGAAAYLLRGQYVAGMLRGALRAARGEDGGPLIPGTVESVSSVKGRNHVRRLAGLGIGKDVAWQPCARAAFGGTIPPGAGEHVLDAAVAAVWAVRPTDEAAPVAPRTPREPGQPRASAHARRAAATAARLDVGGCTCPRPVLRHTDPACPIRAAANAKRASSMAGNANAKKSTAPH